MSRYLIDYSLKNGLGNPSINLYLKGCDKPVKCKDCHNWEFQEEDRATKVNINEIFEELKIMITKYKIFHKHLYISILGGEPLADYNIDITIKIAKLIKEAYPETILVLYSWRTPKEIEYFDYGVLGEYDETKYNSDTLPISSNQFIYDFKNNKVMPNIKLKGAMTI